jgi:hypothetical protein
MTPEVEDRLRAQVTSTLAVAAVPGATRDDLAEELFGHLVERWQSGVDEGLDEDRAADRAISEFGASEDIGHEFARTFHSRLWVSTIGVLLPASVSPDTKPGVVTALRFVLGLTWVWSSVGLVLGIALATPVRALIGTAAELLGLVVIVLAYQALARGQRWALWYALGVVVTWVVSGVWQAASAPPSTFTIPVGAILALILLAIVRGAWPELRAFVAASAPVSGLLGAALVVSLVAPNVASPLLAVLPDPTQATAADLGLRISMTCGRMPLSPSSGAIQGQEVSLTADMTWRRTDLWPEGLIHALAPTPDGDSAGFLPEGDGTRWLPSDQPTVVDLATGQTAGWFGSTSPSIGLLPVTSGGMTIGIDQSAIQPGQSIRATWHLFPSIDAGTTAAWPLFEVAYAHLDRFLVIGTVGCGQTTLGHQAPLPLPHLGEPGLNQPDLGLPNP